MFLRNNGQCPKCAGALRILYDGTLRCFDCHARYEPEEGALEGVLAYKERTYTNGGLDKAAQKAPK